MVTVTYTQNDGTSKDVTVKIGQSVKDGAVNNLIPGIFAECGGACACATCHVYIDNQWVDRVGPAGDVEKEIIEFAEGVQENSRLSCQINISEALDGLIIHVPEEQ
jgi:2Fe-2S ferredoxin